MLLILNRSHVCCLVFLIVAACISVSTAHANFRKKSAVLYVTRGMVDADTHAFGKLLQTKSASFRDFADFENHAEEKNKSGVTRKNTAEKVPGDFLFEQARQSYFDFDTELAMQKIDQAIFAFSREPGMQGNWVEAWLLKAQILLEQGNAHDAIESLTEAVALNLSQSDLDAFDHSGRLRQYYRMVYRDYIVKTDIHEMVITVNRSSAPVYVNGVLRGAGTSITIKCPRNRPQILRAGTALAAKKIKTIESMVSLSPRMKKEQQDSDEVIQANTFLIKPAKLAVLVNQAVAKAEQQGLDEVILLQKEKIDGTGQLTVLIVDVATKKVSHPLGLVSADFDGDKESLVLQAVNFIRNSNPAAYADATFLSGDEPKEKSRNKDKNEKKKSFFASPAGIAIIGVLVAGAGTGAVLALGGGGGGSPGTTGTTTAPTTTVTISGPVPTGP